MILSRYLYDSHWDFNIWFAIKGRLELVYLRVVTMAARGHQSWMEFRVSCQPNIIHFMLYNNVFIPKDESTRKLENNAGLKHTYIYKNSKRKPLFFFSFWKYKRNDIILWYLPSKRVRVFYRETSADLSRWSRTMFMQNKIERI